MNWSVIDKMEVKLNFDDLKLEHEIVKRIFNLVSREELEKLKVSKKNEIDLLRNEIELLNDQLNSALDINLDDDEIIAPRTVSDCVLIVLQGDKSLTINEIMKRVQAKENTLKQTVSNLKSQNVLDSSTSKPYRYFLKSNGDPELKKMLKGSRCSNYE